jgi:peptidoglycan/LPS O-acetylase OafA/YrhL
MARRGAAGVPNYPQDRLAFVEGLRGLAAIYVVLTHIRSMVDPGPVFVGAASAAPPWLAKFLPVLGFGHVAVAAFIVLSGFCLQTSLFNHSDGRLRSLPKFFARRAWRILPAYYSCLALSLVVCAFVTSKQTGYPFAQYVPADARAIVSHLFLVHNFDPSLMFKINGVLWSIALEAQLYLVFPFLVAMLFKVGRVGLVALTSLVSALCLWFIPTANAGKSYIWFLPLFVLGMVAAHFAYRPHRKIGVVPKLGALWALIGIGIFAVGVMWKSDPRWVSFVLRDLGVGVSVAAFIYVGSVRPSSWVSRLFGAKALVKLGAFSYSLYLIHHPLLQVLYVNRPAFAQSVEMATLYLFAAGVPIILLCSWVFAWFFERPFMVNRKVLEPILREGLGTPLALPLRTLGRASEARYLGPRGTPKFAVIEVDESVALPAPIHLP